MAFPRTLGILTATAALAAATGCADRQQDAPANDSIVNNVAAALPAPEPLLDRRGMLLALGDAASAFAAGIDDMADQRDLVGRRFAFRMAFGCDGTAKIDRPLVLTVRPDGKSYEARARFTITEDDSRPFLPSADDPDAIEVPAARAIEKVEGFWIERPWLLAEQCPRPMPAAAGADDDEDADAKQGGEDSAIAQPAIDHVAGLAQFLTPSDSRLSIRGGRDYVKSVTLAEGTTPPAGLFLLVEGRLRAWPDGKAIECRGNPKGGRPVCLIGASIDRVAFERIDDRSLVAEWTN